MRLRWLEPGESMGTVDLSALEGDDVVIHYGGAIKSVDAYTFANSLIAFADTARAVNSAIDPDQNIEIRIEALADGSFRAVIRKVKKGLGGFFSRGTESLLWGVLAAFIYERIFASDPAVVINISNDQVVIERGSDKIIIPRQVYDQLQIVKKVPEVAKNLNRTFEVIETDDAIENFGMTPSVRDVEPLVQVRREDFSNLAESPDLPVALNDPKRRIRREQARLVILKAWLKTGKRKWSFEWNGIPVSAPIIDPSFMDKLSRREYLIGVGDALEVMLKYEQHYDDAAEVYVNDQNSFEIEEVIRVVQRGE